VSWAEGRYSESQAHTEAALVVATRHGRLRDATVAQHDLLWHEIRAGDLAAARRRLATVDRLAAQAGEQRLRVLAAANLAEVARLEGRYEEAVAIGGRVLARLSELGDPGHRRQVLGTLGQAYAAMGRVREAERVLATLRAETAAAPPVGWTPAAAGTSAALEARVALARGDTTGAAEWFAAAATAFRGGPNPRDVVESLVYLAAVTADPAARQRARAELERVIRDGGFALLPLERALLEERR
jgi:tetratricopeptide (TPR) repeat protein